MSLEIDGKPLTADSIAEIVEKLRQAAGFIESGKLKVTGALFGPMGFRVDFKVREEQ